MEDEFEKVELYEKDGNGIGELRLNNKKIKGLTSYILKRGTDIVDVTINISVPIENFKTVEH